MLTVPWAQLPCTQVSRCQAALGRVSMGPTKGVLVPVGAIVPSGAIVPAHAQALSSLNNSWGKATHSQHPGGRAREGICCCPLQILAAPFFADEAEVQQGAEAPPVLYPTLTRAEGQELLVGVNPVRSVTAGGHQGQLGQ